MPLPIVLILVYATIVFAGGLIGYLKAGSKPSLIAGVVSALVLASSAWLFGNEVHGLYVAGGVAGLLTVVFLIRFLKTRSFMPSGMMLALSLAATSYFFYTAFHG